MGKENQQKPPEFRCTPGAQRLIETVREKFTKGGSGTAGLNQWLRALVERHGVMVQTIIGKKVSALLESSLKGKLRKGDYGPATELTTVISKASGCAEDRGRKAVAEKDLATALLLLAGYDIMTGPKPKKGMGGRDLSKSKGLEVQTKMKTATLSKYGRNLTEEARDGKLLPAIGRAEETQLIIETLCRYTKRNPLLIGPPGVGKTAIVEGLACLVARKEIPTVLAGIEIFSVKPSLILAGASMEGEFQKRMEEMLAEASQNKVVLFIDEVQSIIGSGGREGTSDLASILKPALARGEIACIAATTDDEYRRFVQADKALERRFQPIVIREAGKRETVQILANRRDHFIGESGITVDDEVLVFLTEFAEDYFKNRHFPDKAVDLLEQCIAYARVQSITVVGMAEATHVAQRMAGFPVNACSRLDVLKEALIKQGLLDMEEIDLLVGRLSVSMRRLDFRTSRPNAVVLLTGDIARHYEVVIQTMGEILFSGTDRIIDINLAGLSRPEDIDTLTGSPAGYVGYKDPKPIDRVKQIPWCIIAFRNIHACHSQVREFIRQALSEGKLTDAKGEQIYLSDAIVVLTADFGEGHRSRVGFNRGQETGIPAAHETLERVLGCGFADVVDLVCDNTLYPTTKLKGWIQNSLLSMLSKSYQERGLVVYWDESLVDWLLSKKDILNDQREWERFVEEHVSPVLISEAASGGERRGREVAVRYGAGGVEVAPYKQP
jgi:ATP-dependent Clp protease ATP-binding subunit ClpC